MRILLIYPLIFFTTFISAQTWYEKQIIPFDAMENDDFGADVAINDSLLFISSLRYSNSVDASVYVYRFVNNDYIFDNKIYPNDPEPLALFGTKVFYKDGQLFVGARNKKINGAPTGALYIFKYESNNWVQKQIIFPPEPFTWGSYFSNAIAKLNETLVVSAYRAHSGAQYSGKVFIYKYINGEYILQQELAPYDAKDYQYFGISLVLRDNLLFIGSELDSTSSGFESGSIYSYVKQDSNWVFFRKYIPEPNSPNLTLAASMTSNDDYLFAGSASSFSYNQPGKVFIYKISEPFLELHQTIDSGEGYFNDRFGIYMLAKGDTLLVTAFFDTVNNITSGSVYMVVNDNDTWRKIKKIIPSDEQNAYLFGNSLGINRSLFVIGAKRSKHNNIRCGKVYIFSGTPLSIFNEESPLVYRFILYQNYPNPFNSTSTIRYDIPVNGEISVIIFDALGQKVMSNNLGYKNKGIHSFSIDLFGMTSGVYFIKVEFIVKSDNQFYKSTLTKKTILIN